jgi:copper homeostasis protein
MYRNPNVRMGGKAVVIDEYAQQVTAAEMVRNTLQALD